MPETLKKTPNLKDKDSIKDLTRSFSLKNAADSIINKYIILRDKI